MTQNPQQVTLNPFQMIAVTATTLQQLQQWIEGKQGTIEDSHPKHTITARSSIFHTRLLLNLRQQEILKELAAHQRAEKFKQIQAATKGNPQGFLAEIAKEMKPLPLEYIDLEDSKRLFGKVKGQEGC